MSADEAKQYGLIDDVLRRSDDAKKAADEEAGKDE
jgi:ATP-dependent protease ClpP protease subunit